MSQRPIIQHDAFNESTASDINYLDLGTYDDEMTYGRFPRNKPFVKQSIDGWRILLTKDQWHGIFGVHLSKRLNKQLSYPCFRTSWSSSSLFISKSLVTTLQVAQISGDLVGHF